MERVVSQERIVDNAVERPINVPNERIVEKVPQAPMISVHALCIERCRSEK